MVNIMDVPDDVIRNIAGHLDEYGDVIRMQTALRSEIPTYTRPHHYLKTLYEFETYTRTNLVNDPAYKKSLEWCERYRSNRFDNPDGWTDEQMRIINSEAEVTMVQAFAGTGKTTTVFEYMRRRSDKKILYLAFNKALESSAKQRVIDTDMAHVDVYTTHAFALEYLKKEGHLPDDVQVGDLRMKDLLDIYDRSTAYDISKELQAFCASDSSDVYLSEEYNETYKGYVAQQMKMIWKRMCRGEMKVSHDVYLKLFQTLMVQLPYDIIIVDEVQDCTPCQMSIVNVQNARKIYVGDIHQQIYKFRGVCNPFTTQVYTLTKTFRFGHEIGDLCNHFLRIYKHEENVITTPKDTNSKVSVKYPLKGEKHTLICRSHVGTIEAASEIKQPLYLRGIKPINIEKELSIVEDLIHFEDGRKEQIKHKKLRKVVSQLKIDEENQQGELFRTFKELYPDSSKWRIRIMLFRKHGEYMLEKYKSIGEYIVEDEEDAIVILTNVHQAKGLEFDTVMLHDDFSTLCTRDRATRRWIPRVLPLPSQVEEYNLVYVAMTRAMKKLILNEHLKQFVHTLQQWNHPYIQRICDINNECDMCHHNKKCYELKCSNDDISHLGTGVSQFLHTRYVCTTCF
jgi:F-box protein 18 (helicase)